jgi:hypothetical protein
MYTPVVELLSKIKSKNFCEAYHSCHGKIYYQYHQARNLQKLINLRILNNKTFQGKKIRQLTKITIVW